MVPVEKNINGDKGREGLRRKMKNLDVLTNQGG